MDASSVLWLVLLVLGAALIGGGIIAYRGSQKAGTRVLATAAMAAGAAMWAAALVTIPVSSSTGDGPSLPIVKTVPASASPGEPGANEAGLPKSMKGYELYSWQEDGDWRFALVAGTNRQKTYEEITEPGVVSLTTGALEFKLDSLPAGELVFWSADRVPKTLMPSHDIVEQVTGYCRQLGLQLQIDR